jgi:hypothetical protein
VVARVRGPHIHAMKQIASAVILCASFIGCVDPGEPLDEPTVENIEFAAPPPPPPACQQSEGMTCFIGAAPGDGMNGHQWCCKSPAYCAPDVPGGGIGSLGTCKQRLIVLEDEPIEDVVIGGE